jgi:hypothetical protein
MTRTILILFGAIIAVTLLRSSIGLITRSLQQVMNPPAPKDPNLVDMVKCPSCGSVFAPHQHQKKS